VEEFPPNAAMPGPVRRPGAAEATIEPPNLPGTPDDTPELATTAGIIIRRQAVRLPHSASFPQHERERFLWYTADIPDIQRQNQIQDALCWVMVAATCRACACSSAWPMM
jgi:hypothetical protein